MDWRIKGVVQGVLSRLPVGEVLNDGLQRWTGGRVGEARQVDMKFQRDWLVLMRVLRDLKFDVRGQTLMEVGTSCLPVLPLCFALCGARTVHSFDLKSHPSRSTVPAVLQRLGQHLQAVAGACGQTEAEVRERHAWLAAAGHGPDADARVLELAGIDYRAAADATSTGLPDHSVSLVFSNSVLEHVCASVLGPLMSESRRLLKPGGLALHSVNCGDHYAYFDRSISALNYLRFTADEWQRWNNALMFQNRLRPSDFVALAQGQGLRVIHQIQTERNDLLASLSPQHIAPEFRRYTPQDLCSTSVTFAAQHWDAPWCAS